MSDHTSLPSAEEVNEWSPHQVIEFLESYNKEKSYFLEMETLKITIENRELKNENVDLKAELAKC
ncbi:12710_t:CDS:2 [Racocetra persica]|uniref:12710_t:CDS:1 n=1 Tax=Racocetra persica TaxID=160502 RepID=A0ACA9R0M3_9GLOM|nr:12710_t:CDS:2 [Racocetra persica]